MVDHVTQRLTMLLQGYIATYKHAWPCLTMFFICPCTAILTMVDHGQNLCNFTFIVYYGQNMVISWTKNGIPWSKAMVQPCCEHGKPWFVNGSENEEPVPFPHEFFAQTDISLAHAAVGDILVVFLIHQLVLGVTDLNWKAEVGNASDVKNISILDPISAYVVTVAMQRMECNTPVISCCNCRKKAQQNRLESRPC